MSRSINGDGGSTTGVALTVMDQTETKQTVKADINLLYTCWVNCTRASRFYLHVGDAVFVCGVGDSVTHLNHIVKIFIVSASDFKVVLRKDAKADNNDSIRIQQFSFIKLTVL